MKKVYYSLLMVALVAMTASCNKVSYKKTKSGMLYKIIPSGSKDSAVKEGEWLKLNFVQKLNDSVVQSTYGKMPMYAKVNPTQGGEYSPVELFTMLKKGDSVVAVLLVDSLLRKGLIQRMEPNMKKSDRITFHIKIADIFKNDSLYQADAKLEYDKDLPRMQKEQEEQAVKRMKEIKVQKDKDEAEAEKSGEAAKEIKDMEAYLAAKNIKAEKTGKGTFVAISQQGTGAAAEEGKYVHVKYSGRVLRSDSTFESGAYPFGLGINPVITGWEEGLKQFKQGGKGTIYVPGFLAYGANPRPGSGFRPFEALIFDIELLEVSDKPIEPQAPQGGGQQPPPQRRN